MPRGQAPVAIVGAGLAGLVAARELRRRGVPVSVYEAGKQVAGLAKSFRDEEGFSYDFGAHFITNRLAAAIGAEAKCLDVRHYGEAVRVRGNTYSYPFGLARSPRFLAGAVRSLAIRIRNGAPPASAADWFRAEYGSALADEVAIPLVEAWSGAPGFALAPSVGEKFGGGMAHALLMKAASRVMRRAVAHGYCREQPESVRVWHVYPTGGVSTLCEQLAGALGDAVHLQSPVESIVVESGRVVAVRVNGALQEVAAVMSTAPVHILSSLVTGTDVLRHLARFRYRAMVFVNLCLRGRGLLPDTVLWTPDKDLDFFRLTETPRSMPWLAPAGKTLITVDLGCAVGDPVWASGDEALAELCLQQLQAILPDVRRRYLGSRVLRTPIAYPVFLSEYEQDRQRLERDTGVEGLYSIGRNGEFAHILMEDVYWRTLRRVGQLVSSWGPAAKAGAFHDNGV